MVMYVYQRIAIELEDTGDTVYYHSELDTSKSFAEIFDFIHFVFVIMDHQLLIYRCKLYLNQKHPGCKKVAAKN